MSKITKKLDKGFNITKKDKQKVIETDFVIDVNKRTSNNKEPRFTG